MSVIVPFTTLPAANEARTTPERRGLARDEVRLLVTDPAARTHVDATFRDLPAFLRPGDLVVVNDSATLPAALAAWRAGGTMIPFHLSTQIADDLWVAEPRGPAGRGERLALPAGGAATLLNPIDPARPRLWHAALDLPAPLAEYLASYGAPIRYRYVTEPLPLADYQTIFARVPGSAEMPSAGRPFTPRVLDALHKAGVGLATITLHTGVSSPERDERPYRERFSVETQTAAAVNTTRRRGGRIIAVGTTVVRALESAADGDTVFPASGWTDLIVTPQRGVAVVDGLLTGFHEPQASHLDLLRAFVDSTTLDAAYQHAIERGYIWHEFGDVQLIVRS